PEVPFVCSRRRLVGVPCEAEVDRQFELRGVRQEELLVGTLLLQPTQLRAAGVRLAERDETEDGDEREQRGDGERAEDLLRAERQWDARERAYQGIVRTPAKGAFFRYDVNRLSRGLHRSDVLARPRSCLRPPTPARSGRAGG